MRVTEIRNHIESLCSHLTFEYNGKNCGVDPLSHNQIDMWCGDDAMTATSIDEVMESPFFNGQSLRNIANKIENIEM